MSDELLTAAVAARRLGISPATFYSWLGDSDYGLLKIRGRPVTIDYLQGGPQGAGKIGIEVREVERLRELMRVRAQQRIARRPAIAPKSFPGIHVPLGRPR